MEVTETSSGRRLVAASSRFLNARNRLLIRRILLEADLTAVSLALAAAALLFYLISSSFVSQFNLDSLALFSAIAIIVSLGQMLVLSIGQFNLAIGAMGACGAIAAAALMQDSGCPVWLAIPAGLVVGMLAGAFQGVLIAYTPLNPFVVTLALASVYLGAATGATSAGFFDNLPSGFDNIGSATILGLSDEWWAAIGVAAVIWAIMRLTSLGPRLLATGGNRAAAFNAGVRVKMLTVVAHALSGVLGAGAGILLAAQLNSAQISIGGDWMLLSFAGPVLGGTALSGGKISIVGAVIGGCFMTVLQNGLVIAGVSPYWVSAIYGVVLVAAFAIDRMRRRRTLRTASQ
jgi:ribose transport system permease protein